MSKRYDVIPCLFWISVSIFVMICSYELGLGNFSSSGPGLMPFLIGIALFAVSIPILITSLSRIRAKNDMVIEVARSKINVWKVGSVVLSLFLYCLLLNKLGYIVATSLLFIFLFRAGGSRKWRFILLASLLTVIATYLGFTFLGLRFPKGIWR